MVKEEVLRGIRAESGRKGGRAKAAKDFAIAKLKQNPGKILDSVCIDSKTFSFSSEGENAPLDGVVARFVKPTLEEVKSYCIERNNQVDAEYWYDHYEGNGWLVGKVKMKNWKAVVRNWEKNDFGTAKKTGDLFDGQREFLRVRGL